jgi:hypothetical protein
MLAACYGDDHHFFHSCVTFQDSGALMGGGSCGQNVIDKQDLAAFQVCVVSPG